MIEYKIGDRVLCRPEVNIDRRGDQAAPIVAGHIVWIHPQRRYVVVGCRIGDAIIREAFLTRDVRLCKEEWSI